MAIQRPADARPVAAHAFRGFNGLIGHEVVAWRPGFVEMSLKVRPDLCNANGLLHGGVLMTLLDSASGFACTFNDTATARRLSVTLAFTTQFIKAARDGDVLSILGAWRPSTSQSTFAAETEIYDQKGDLVATGAGTFRYLKGERSDATLTFLAQKPPDYRLPVFRPLVSRPAQVGRAGAAELRNRFPQFPQAFWTAPHW